MHNKRGLAAAILMAAAMAVAVYLSVGKDTMPAIVVPVLGIYAIMSYADRIFLAKAGERRERSSISDTLAMMYRNARHFKKPLRSCIDEALDGVKFNGPSADALREARRRLDLGEDMGFALRASANGKGSQLGRIWGEGNTETWEYIGAAVERMREEMAEDDERAAESMQRHTAIAVVIGTVVPSLLLFAFTGYSIVGPSEVLLPAFAFMVAGVIPFAYSVTQMQLVGPYG